MARGKPGEFLMANGRAAAVEPHDALAGERFIAIGEIVGRAASARILTAAPLTREEIDAVAAASIATADELTFDRDAAALRARRRRRLGALILAEQTSSVPADEASALALASGVLSLGVARLPWTKSLKQWRDRVLFLRRAEEGVWPDLSDKTLAASPDWLAPFLLGKTSLADIGADDLALALHSQLDPALVRRLDSDAPTHFVAPTGTAAAVDYEAEGGPSIALRVQELFGLSTHPALAGGTRAADAASAVARASANPDHARLARLLERVLVGRALGPARPLPQTFLAREPCRRRAHDAGEAANAYMRARSETSHFVKSGWAGAQLC